jgi:hypothetical protein
VSEEIGLHGQLIPNRIVAFSGVGEEGGVPTHDAAKYVQIVPIKS